MAEPPSSPPSAEASTDVALAWYKSQYELLENELSEFQASSKELEAELEKDLDAADKRERMLQQKAETLSYEVEEWKRKYEKYRTEANSAQGVLEKEITTLRDANRTLQLRLRDIEVANDDFERQARNTTSSLEDLESKYNVAIERGVMMEEEIKIGEQERERLRVESQRLREELSDLKIEAEILQGRVKKQESRHLSAISTDLSVPSSPMFSHSPNSTASSPLVTTPPDDSKPLSTPRTTGMHDPPSPPMSDTSVPLPKAPAAKTPAPASQRKTRLPSADTSVTPKPKHFGSSVRAMANRTATASGALRTPAHRNPVAKPTPRATQHRAPPSNSLTHIRTLTAQMARLEARVQSARSKLPAPVNTPPRASPRASASAGIPSTVTIRSRKRTVGSTSSSIHGGLAESTPTHDFRSSISSTTSVSGVNRHVSRLSTSGVSRLSFGPLPNRNPTAQSSSSAASHNLESEVSRPSSRASISSYGGIPRPASRADSHGGASSMIPPPPRPMSRTSMTGTRTPLGRPRSSMSGSVHGGPPGHGHGHSQSVSYSTAEVDERDLRPENDKDLKTPNRRGTFSRLDLEGGGVSLSAIPVPASSGGGGGGGSGGVGGTRRQSGGSVAGRRSSMAGRKLEDVGETW